MQTPHSVAVLFRRVLSKNNLGPIEDSSDTAVQFQIVLDGRRFKITVEEVVYAAR